ncbi:MAG TPA: hypothetical protein DCE41_11850 [Cytophagales bacterium]|nr:hypothetical protein [Cytophagales bacterium]HAA18110.1 hypothetical protein [Cytophagales bacterium]HAP61888.1 hypothetical protein [Cytophagales bacterium]
MKRSWTYILLQLIGWTLFGVYLMAMVFIWGEGWEGDHRFIWLNVVIPIVCGLVSHGMRAFYRRQGWAERRIKWILPRTLLVSLVFAFIAQVIIHGVIYGPMRWGELQNFQLGSFLIYTSNVFLMYCIWSAIYFSEHAFARNRRDELEKWKLKAALKEAELMALKAQVNPHFLFNALNNIRALVLEDGDRARNMISHLSDMLRYSVQSNEHKQVPLQQELDMVQNYLTLEGNQYEDRLRYSLEVSPNTLDKPVPSMAVQILVENAVKHGISQLPGGGEVSIRSRLDGDRLLIEVENTGTLNKKSEGLGIGLANIKERAKLLFGQLATVSIEETQQPTVRARISLPLNPAT